MATYKGIKGVKIQSLAADPTASSDTDGKVWYNTTGNVLKYVEAGTGAWSSGGAMNQVSGAWRGCCGTQTAGLAATGIASVGVDCETYDGSSWTEVNDVNTARTGSSGAGSQTAGIIFGGSIPPFTTFTETYNGTSWSEVNDLNTARYYGGSASAAPQATARYFAGQSPAGAGVLNESYDGTSWAEEADLNTARQGGIGAGTTNSALMTGGYATFANCESWNGTSWSEENDLNTGSGELSGCGVSNTAAITYGGSPPPSGSNRTESWNGTSWTAVAVMATSTYARTDIGSSSLALAGGGNVSPAGETEEWNDPVYTVKTVTTS